MITTNELKAEWKRVKSDARTRWVKLTDADIEQIDGNADQLVQRLQERYRFPRQIVLAEVGHFLSVE
ncbi:MAG: CsbD family protein [Acidobacteriota bacterium]